uniref:Integrase, catalytic region, zinc finger, CCHC-type, peptidase aspartic, catalytic n=1 Tax=Tanacetum cinerariifolium TaxID=118510 RepID=A0A6L2MP45_TANCI|nr:integrase, catalytic region, zinc finger, CCHC-type, peptidase aspartic, catalytic [Tanacetum cinerariifolium]
MGDENHIRTLGDNSRPSHEGYQNTIKLPDRNNVVPLRSDTIRLMQNGCSFHELPSEDPNQHLKDFLKLVDLLDLDVANRERMHLYLFQFSLRDQASNWLECLLAGSISTWEDLTTPWTRFKDIFQKVPHYSIDLWLQVQIFYDHVNPATRRTIDQSPGGKLRYKNAKETWALLEGLALYDNESWNDPRDFAKPVKAISLPQDVLSKSDHRLIELENQHRPPPQPESQQSSELGFRTNKTIANVLLLRIFVDLAYFCCRHGNAATCILAGHHDFVFAAMAGRYFFIRFKVFLYGNMGDVLSWRGRLAYHVAVADIFVIIVMRYVGTFLNGFVNLPNEINMDDLESDDESVDTPLVSPFLNSDDDSDECEVLNDLEEYRNSGKLCLNIITRKAYNTIMVEGLKSTRRNLVAIVRDVYVFVRSFTYVTDFVVLEDIRELFVSDMAEVVMGKPFRNVTQIEYDCVKGLVSFTREKIMGENILLLIDEGPFKMGKFKETLVEGTEGALHLRPERDRVVADLTPEEKKDIWDNVKMLLEASELTKDKRESQLYDEFEHFCRNKRETIHEYYVRVVVQNVQDRQNRGQGYNARGAVAAGNGRVHNKRGNANLVQAKPINCYNCNGIWHIARQCTHPKRPQNLKYFKDKMLLMQAQENGVVLDEEHILFIAGGKANTFEDDIMFMANLSSAYLIYDGVGPSYDSNILSEDTLELAEITRKRMLEKVKNPLCVKKKVKIAPPHYSNENYLETFTPQRHLTPEQIFWSSNISKMTSKSISEMTMLFRAENAKIKQHYKELYDFIKITHAKTIEKTSSLLTKNENLKAQLKGKMKCVTMDTVKPKVLAPGMYAIDVEPISPRNRNNMEVHLDDLKHLKESVETVREIVEEARIEKPLDNALEYACLYNKRSQELLEYVIGTCPKVFGCSKHMTGNHSRLKNFMKMFIGIVRFRNDHCGVIMGYGDYVIGDSVISKVYYVEGLGHNLFSVGQFYDSDLEVAFRKHSCYVRDVDGVELLKEVETCCFTYRRFTRREKDCFMSKGIKQSPWEMLLLKLDIYAAGSESRPPMLNKENYVPWSSRFLCFFFFSSIAMQTSGSDISNLLAVATTFTGSGNLYCQEMITSQLLYLRGSSYETLFVLSSSNRGRLLRFLI